MIFILILLIIILLLILHLLNKKEPYIDYNYTLLTIPSSAYDNLNINPNKYFYEFKDQFFINVLNENKSQKNFEINNFKNSKLSIQQKQQLEKIIKKYIENILNKEIKKDNNLFYVYRFIINDIKNNNNLYLVNSSLILYRNNKIYGISLKINTIHTINTEEIELKDYDLLGFIFEDKLHTNSTLPKNIYTNEYENSNTINKIIKTPDYEKKNICLYLENLKKFRNIEADDYKELCIE